jgi:mono/diheme cytochrome c family protein
MRLIISAIVSIILTLFSIQGLAQTKALKKHPGKMIYEKYNCGACHGKEGISPFKLTNAVNKYDTSQMILFIKDPAKFNNERMPAFEGIVNEEEYKMLIEYVYLLGRNALRKE